MRKLNNEWSDKETDTLRTLLREKPGKTNDYYARAMEDKIGRRYTAESIRKKKGRMKVKKDEQRETKTVEPVVLEYKETTEILQDGSHRSDKLLEMSVEQSKDVNYLLEAHGYDAKAWELINAKNNIWNVYSQQDGVQTLYSSRITTKPRKDNISLEYVKEVFDTMNRTYQPRPIKYITSTKKKMLELNIADLHLGKLCWSGDSGDTYDMKIAEQRFFYIIEDVLSKISHIPIEKILFVWSNDFFHFDTIGQTTTAGTLQDSDTRWAKMYNKGVEMLTQATEQLTQIAPVETMYIGSNHDKMTAYYATKHLEAWFRNDRNVKVDARPISRKYYEYGNNLIEFTHGHSEGKRIGSTMEVEAREAWGRTLYHEVHAAHFHSDQVKTMDNGTVIRYSPSPTGTDVYHHDSGYVGAIKKGQSYIWDTETGLDLIIPTTIKG